ncbi:MAG: SDR family oxidoreductase [Opitutaceae bacterium]|jgi:NAD(P)-dependent dehydrogenase (short-subunit alcohol dehydrogenase family)|nr:SDR family oxidoreductase [Opitutaceae bacterium]
MSYARNLAGKSIWITGGAGYLGSAITRALDTEAAQVVCIDLPGKAEALVREHDLQRTIPVTLDVNDPDTLPAAIDQLVVQHGLPDGVAHLAFASSSGHRLEDLPVEIFQNTFARSLAPAFVLCRALAEKMKTRGTGNIVVFSSMYGVVAPDPRIYSEPMTPNPIDYGASKAALLQMTRYLAVHYGPANLRFNAITPGPFPPPAVQEANLKFAADLHAKTALNRCGVNEEIVGPTLFLLSDSASYVTGHSLVVDGGWTSW